MGIARTGIWFALDDLFSCFRHSNRKSLIPITHVAGNDHFIAVLLPASVDEIVNPKGAHTGIGVAGSQIVIRATEGYRVAIAGNSDAIALPRISGGTGTDDFFLLTPCTVGAPINPDRARAD